MQFVYCMELIPSKLSSQRFNQPCVTTKTKQICRRKKHLYRRAHLSNWTAYYCIKKLAQSECRKAHSEYVSKLVSCNTAQRIWSYIKSKPQEYSGISSLQVKDNTYTADSDKANILNDQFDSAFTREDTSFIPSISGDTYPAMIPVTALKPGHYC